MHSAAPGRSGRTPRPHPRPNVSDEHRAATADWVVPGKRGRPRGRRRLTGQPRGPAWRSCPASIPCGSTRSPRKESAGPGPCHSAGDGSDGRTPVARPEVRTGWERVWEQEEGERPELWLCGWQRESGRSSDLQAGRSRSSRRPESPLLFTPLPQPPAITTTANQRNTPTQTHAHAPIPWDLPARRGCRSTPARAPPTLAI